MLQLLPGALYSCRAARSAMYLPSTGEPAFDQRLQQMAARLASSCGEGAGATATAAGTAAAAVTAKDGGAADGGSVDGGSVDEGSADAGSVDGAAAGGAVAGGEGAEGSQAAEHTGSWRPARADPSLEYIVTVEQRGVGDAALEVGLQPVAARGRDLRRAGSGLAPWYVATAAADRALWSLPAHLAPPCLPAHVLWRSLLAP